MGKRPASAFVCPVYSIYTLFTELLHVSECMQDACLFVLSALVRRRYQRKQLNLAEKVKKKKKKEEKQQAVTSSFSVDGVASRN